MNRIWNLVVPLIAGAVIVLMAGITALSTQSFTGDPNLFFALWVFDFVVIILGGLAALLSLIYAPRTAPGVLGAMLYTLVLSIMFARGTFTWGRTDNAFLGMFLIAIVLLLMGGGLGIASAVLLW